MPPDAAWLPCVRAEVRMFLHGVASDDELDDVVLSVQEACKNGIRHGGTDVLIHMSLNGGDLVVTVRDRGNGFEPARDHGCPDPLQLSGRGLFLMRSAMDEVTITVRKGTTVRMRKRLARASSGDAAGG